MTSSESLRAGYSTRMEIPLAVQTEYKRAPSAMKTCSRKQFAPAFTLAPALRGRFRAFTLVEMLVVLGMIVILLSAVLPTVTSRSKANGRKAAMANLLGGIEQARAEAIKSSQATYVVFPTFGAGTAQSILDRYNYRSFAVFEDDPLNPVTPKQISGWKILPTGVSLRSGISSWSSANLTFTPTGGSQAFPYLKFNADGGVESPTPAPAPSPTPTP